MQVYLYIFISSKNAIVTRIIKLHTCEKYLHIVVMQ